MRDQIKNRCIFLLLGILTGVFFSLLSGVLLYKALGGVRVDQFKDSFARKISSLASDSDARVSLEEFIDLSKEGVDVFTASSLDRIFLDGKVLEKPVLSKDRSLSVARNEFESFQVVVMNHEDQSANIRLDISELIDSATGNKINMRDVYWRVMGYVETQKPYYPTKYVGLWPDPLLYQPSVEVEGNKTQSFWISVYIREDVPAGDYQGTVKVIADEKELESVPFNVHVYNFVLPKKSSLKTAFDFYGHETFKRYPQRDKERKGAYDARLGHVNDLFQIMMLKYRMNPVLNINPNLQEDLAKVDRYRWFGLNNFSIGKRGGTLGNNWPKTKEEIENLIDEYRSFGELLSLYNIIDDTYIYTWDEGKIGDPIVKDITNMIHRAHPGLKNMVCYHGFWEPSQFPGWGDDIDIWCFQISNFNERKMAVLKEKGMDIWMYISGPSGDTTPNLALDFDSIDYRVIPWMCWKYDIKGFLYWCVNWWPFVDPFESAKNTKWEQNGNGLLFYPGE
ncbi:glycoside hydrolase domain-containing protein, partial [Candidatus Omnitrophota bacterium]